MWLRRWFPQAIASILDYGGSGFDDDDVRNQLRNLLMMMCDDDVMIIWRCRTVSQVVDDVMVWWLVAATLVQAFVIKTTNRSLLVS